MITRFLARFRRLPPRSIICTVPWYTVEAPEPGGPFDY